MEKKVLIFNIERMTDWSYKSHFKLYDKNRRLEVEDDFIYKMRIHRNVKPGYLKSKVRMGLTQHLMACGYVKRQTELRAECLMSLDAIKTILANKPTPEKPVQLKMVETFVKKVEIETEENPRIYQVVLVNGNYTIVKTATKYLTREQAKEELFNKVLENA